MNPEYRAMCPRDLRDCMDVRPSKREDSKVDQRIPSRLEQLPPVTPFDPKKQEEYAKVYDSLFRE